MKLVGAAALVTALPTLSNVRAEQTIPESHFIDIPYYAQIADAYCGVACTQMLFAYLNPQAVPTQDALAQELGTDKIGFTTPDHMVAAFQSTGYTEVYSNKNLNIDRLKELISYEIPINTLGGFRTLDPHPTPSHWIVAVGYDDTHKQMIVNDPNYVQGLRRKNRHIDYSLFDQLWTSSPNVPGQRNGVVVPYKGSTYIPPP